MIQLTTLSLEVRPQSIFIPRNPHYLRIIYRSSYCQNMLLVATVKKTLDLEGKQPNNEESVCF